MRTKHYDVENVGKKFKKRREDRKMSMDALAEQTGLSKSTISRIENGQNYPSIYVFAKLCEALYISIDALFVYK